MLNYQTNTDYCASVHVLCNVYIHSRSDDHSLIILKHVFLQKVFCQESDSTLSLIIKFTKEMLMIRDILYVHSSVFTFFPKVDWDSPITNLSKLK
jgi:hypothetical protein